MPDLTEFLRERLAEDEAAARACCDINDLARALSGRPLPRWEYDVQTGRLARGDIPLTKGGTWQREGEHMARWDPARVLAEVAAKRAIIADLMEGAHPASSDYPPAPDANCAADQYPGRGSCTCGRTARITRSLLLLAQPYASHPDFDPAWTA